MVRGSCIGVPISPATIVAVARRRTAAVTERTGGTPARRPRILHLRPLVVHPVEAGRQCRTATFETDAQPPAHRADKTGPPAPPPGSRTSEVAAPRPVLPRDGSWARSARWTPTGPASTRTDRYDAAHGRARSRERRRHRCASRAVPEPRALVARVQRARARARRGSVAAAARTGQVPRDLQSEPRRVLPGAGRGSPGAGPRRASGPGRPTGWTRSSSSARSGHGSTSSSTRQATVFTKDIAPALEDVGIRFSDWDELDDDDRAYLVTCSRRRVFPVLTPLAVDPAHPFPYISNLSLNLAVVVRDPETERAAVRAGQGPAAAPPLRRAARRRALRAARAGHRRAPRRAVPGHGGARPTTRSA